MRKSKYPESPKTFGEIIRKKRMDSNLSLKDVSKRTKLTEGYLSRIESDIQMPMPEAAETIAKALGDDFSTYIPHLYRKYFPDTYPFHLQQYMASKFALDYHAAMIKLDHSLNQLTKSIHDEKGKKAVEDMKRVRQEIDTKYIVFCKSDPTEVVKEKPIKKRK